MATIKSFTDIKQSKKLAEILPIESADMKILPFTEREYRVVPINDIAVCGREDEIYAWSLASLLDVLPKGYSIGRRTTGKYYVCMTHIEHKVSEYDNPIDACVDMIEHLHKLNLL